MDGNKVGTSGRQTDGHTKNPDLWLDNWATSLNDGSPDNSTLNFDENLPMPQQLDNSRKVDRQLSLNQIYT